MSKKPTSQSGFAHVGPILLLVIVLGVAGGGGYYVWKKNHDQKKTSDSSQSDKKVASYDDCVKSDGSRIQESYPATCVTKDNKRFTQPIEQKYLTIKEWGVKIPLSAAVSGAYYKVDTNIQQSSSNPTNLTVYAAEADNVTGPAGESCKGEYIAYLLRLPSDDSKWQSGATVDNGRVAPDFTERTVIGDYHYAISTKKQYGPNCWATSKTGDYKADTMTQQSFQAVVDAFVADFKNVAAE